MIRDVGIINGILASAPNACPNFAIFSIFYEGYSNQNIIFSLIVVILLLTIAQSITKLYKDNKKWCQTNADSASYCVALGYLFKLTISVPFDKIIFGRALTL